MDVVKRCAVFGGVMSVDMVGAKSCSVDSPCRSIWWNGGPVYTGDESQVSYYVAEKVVSKKEPVAKTEKKRSRRKRMRRKISRAKVRREKVTVQSKKRNRVKKRKMTAEEMDAFIFTYPIPHEHLIDALLAREFPKSSGRHKVIEDEVEIARKRIARKKLGDFQKTFEDVYSGPQKSDAQVAKLLSKSACSNLPFKFSEYKGDLKVKVFSERAQNKISRKPAKFFPPKHELPPLEVIHPSRRRLVKRIKRDVDKI